MSRLPALFCDGRAWPMARPAAICYDGMPNALPVLLRSRPCHVLVARHFTPRRQPIVTPICRGRTSPHSARRGPAAPEEAVCTRPAPAGGRTEALRLARLSSTPARFAPPRGTDCGTDAQSWACGNGAFDVRLNDAPINKIKQLLCY